MVNFHKVLISTAIVFTAVFTVWSSYAWAGTGDFFWAGASAVGFGIATIALLFYLKNLRRFLGQ